MIRIHGTKKLVLFTTLAVVVYVCSFAVIRAERTSYSCLGYEVEFPAGIVREFYRPLIVADKFLNFPILYGGEPDEAVYAIFDAQPCE